MSVCINKSPSGIHVLSSKYGEYHIEINWFIVLDDCVPDAETMDILG